ncbi:cytochrome c oxidase subunit 3 family protein [Zoogloea sp.]|jgi:cytochrome c oxidase subunit 3|uniref:cytochrome c oxidase subunit 3 family protein n=1 Tax=Zoogloea sp. TaxID=49181 RepID=UPI0035AD9A6F
MELAIAPPAGRPMSMGKVPGNRGIWVGILCELSEFALMFLAWGWFRFSHPDDFRAGPAQLLTGAGIANTVVMLTSGYFAVRALLAIRRGEARTASNWLIGTLLGGIAFLLIKAWEFSWNIDHGVVGTGNSFVAMYYYLTFNHLVHVVWGCLGLIWAILRCRFGAYSPEDHEGLEAATLYWHATDLAWIVIFPLLYVLR